MPDERTRVMRRRLARRSQLVEARTRVKNEIHAILIRRLKGRPDVSDLFGRKGRAWLAELELPIEERETLDSGLRQIDFLDAEVASVDRVLAHDALNWPQARRLMTVPGVNLIAAATFLAAVGNIERFPIGASWSATSAWTPRSASAATRPPRTGTSPSKARPRSGSRWWKPAGAPSASQARCEPSTAASAPVAATRSPSPPPRASSRACSGCCSGANRTTPSGNPR
jgi:hypothetical protein